MTFIIGSITYIILMVGAGILLGKILKKLW